MRYGKTGPQHLCFWQRVKDSASPKDTKISFKWLSCVSCQGLPAFSDWKEDFEPFWRYVGRHWSCGRDLKGDYEWAANRIPENIVRTWWSASCDSDTFNRWAEPQECWEPIAFSRINRYSSSSAHMFSWWHKDGTFLVSKYLSLDSVTLQKLKLLFFNIDTGQPYTE